MYNMTIELKDNGILRRLQQAPQSVVNPAMNKFMSKASLMVVQRAKEKAPRAQGTLSGSINATPVKKTGNGYESSVGTNVEYAPHQEYGTGIYGKHGRPITPKGKKVLAWKGGKFGKGWHFARQVKGVRPKKFMKAGIEYLQSRQQGLVNELAAEIKRGIEG
jgi:hypothetical protein